MAKKYWKVQLIPSLQKPLENTGNAELQEELLENVKNAEHLKEKVQTSESRVCLSDVTNCLKVRKSTVPHNSDSSNCSLSVLKILPSIKYSIIDPIIAYNEVPKSSLILQSQFETINNTSLS